MKFKPTVILATFVVTMGLLLGASAAQAATVDLEDATAVRINNLEVDGTLYNVTFTAGTWPDVYGGTPPQLDVTKRSAPDFIEAINIALTDFEAVSSSKSTVAACAALAPSSRPSVTTNVAKRTVDLSFMIFLLSSLNLRVWGSGLWVLGSGPPWCDGMCQ